VGPGRRSPPLRRGRRRSTRLRAAEALVDGLCAGVALPPLTVCSLVTGTALPWGPLGPVGLAAAGVALGQGWSADRGAQQRANAALAASLLCAAACPRTEGGAAAVALLLVGSVAIAGLSGGDDRGNERLRGSAASVVPALLWVVLAGGVWLAASSTAGLPASQP